MQVRSLSSKRKLNIPIYEHLDIGLKCTHAQRLQWLEDANNFVRKIQRKRAKKSA